ncbi:hypothetical protein IB238_24095 [Rhizobium sp. ARZ01]|uniref:hypothetical protein n=1 Tax=Rhizobium sp. ARZ01 TaxID=2769313 RepID=UPI0017803C27|nr:hypothetical protein [Rhizobium sp. ARZ01]MBD9375689.1 hypothetical protein [Rhizobium sp. ARZ01]
MGKMRKEIYEALIEGASDGLTDSALYNFVVRRCPKTSSKKIVRAALGALEDSNVRDENVLRVVYALAITERLRHLGVNDQPHKSAPVAEPDAQLKRKAKKDKDLSVPAEMPVTTH